MDDVRVYGDFHRISPEIYEQIKDSIPFDQVEYDGDVLRVDHEGQYLMIDDFIETIRDLLPETVTGTLNTSTISTGSSPATPLPPAKSKKRPLPWTMCSTHISANTGCRENRGCRFAAISKDFAPAAQGRRPEIPCAFGVIQVSRERLIQDCPMPRLSGRTGRIFRRVRCQPTPVPV